MDIWNLLPDVVLLLAGALLLGAVSSRFGQSPLVGYLLAGMILGGPGSLHAVQSQREVEAIAELGVSLLLYSLGLEFSVARLRQLGGRMLLGGVVQVGMTILVFGLCALAVGFSAKTAVAVGAIVSLSSTAVVLRILTEMGDMESAHGRNSLAILLAQDMAVVPLAVMMGLLAGADDPATMLGNVGRIVWIAALLVLGLYVLLNHVAVRALGTLTLERNRELTVVLAVVTGLGSAWAAHAAGISPALGAFVAGMFLGSSPFATQIRADVSSLRVVLLTLFFAAVGMVADPIWMVQNAAVVLAFTATLILLKMSIVWFIFQRLGQSPPIAAATGIAVAQVGEFAFVLGSIGLAGGVISSETHQLVVSATIVSLFISPFMVPRAPKLGALLASWVCRRDFSGVAPTRDADKKADLVIIGFGPVGRSAARAAMGSNARILVVDLNVLGVRSAREMGLDAHIGDATQVDILEHAHVSTAKVVVITIPHQRSAIAIVENVRLLAPLAHVVVRSRYERDTHGFATAGAHVVVGDEEEVGARLGSHLLEWMESNDLSSRPAKDPPADGRGQSAGDADFLPPSRKP